MRRHTHLCRGYLDCNTHRFSDYMEPMESFEQIYREILKANKVVISSHRSPDGDSIGCSLGLYHFLRKLSKDVHIVHPDLAPEFLQWVEGAEQIICYDTTPELAIAALTDADLLISVDYNAPNRVGTSLEPFVRAFKGRKVVIDHHLEPDLTFYDLVLSDTTAGSTSELIYKLIEASGNDHLIDRQIGTPLYLGIMTDTGSFRFPSMKAETHEILARLMRAGVVHYEVHEKVFDTNTVERLKLRGYAISEKLELIPARPIAYMSLTQSELERFNYQKGDTEGLVNVALSVEGIKVAAFFAEKDGVVKISFRSKGEFYVNQLASDHFEGGGHKYAAGGVSHEGIVKAVEKFKSLISNYFPEK